MVNTEDIVESISISKVLYLSIKRLFDIIIGLIGVICLIPLSIIIKLVSVLSGDFKPIFYSQMRIGKNGKEFKLYKFRSMVMDADEKLEKLIKSNEKIREEYKLNKKLDNDPRITKIGKVLRKTSLDETPQFINVFFGVKLTFNIEKLILHLLLSIKYCKYIFVNLRLSVILYLEVEL